MTVVEPGSVFYACQLLCIAERQHRLQQLDRRVTNILCRQESCLLLLGPVFAVTTGVCFMLKHPPRQSRNSSSSVTQRCCSFGTPTSGMLQVHADGCPSHRSACRHPGNVEHPQALQCDEGKISVLAAISALLHASSHANCLVQLAKQLRCMDICVKQAPQQGPQAVIQHGSHFA